MIDDMLFQRGEILTRIGTEVDDYNSIIADYFFNEIMELDGEIVDSNGSEYTLDSIDKDNNFNITFTVFNNDFETTKGRIVGFTELKVSCFGTVIEEDGVDVLDIRVYQLISKK